MAEYEITAPDGRKFRVSGSGTREQALAQVQAQYAQRPQSDPRTAAAVRSGELPALPGEIGPDRQPQPPRPSLASETLDFFKRGLGRTARMGAEAVGALPMMAADMGVSARNLIEGPLPGGNYLTGPFRHEPASSMYQRGLDEIGLPRAQGVGEKVVDVAGQMVMGSRLPVPSINNPAPANFVSPANQALQQASRAGYVVPPATARPNSSIAGVAEGAAGKLTTAQAASAANQSVTNRLAAQAVGIADDGTVSREALSAIRTEAGRAHEALRNFPGPIVSDTAYRVAITDATRSLEKVANQLPALAQKDLLNIAKGLEQPRFDPDVAVDAIRLLRDRADTAYRAGDGTVGRAYRALSDAFEGLVERRLTASGPQGAELVQNFRSARELIAKTYTIEGALKGENVNAQALASALDKGRYLSGTLRQIGQFAQNFPKAARVIPATESLPPYSPLDMFAIASSLGGGGVASLMTDHPAAAAAYLPAIYAASRPAIRNFLLSPAGQRMLVNGMPSNALAPVAGAAAPTINALRE